MCVQKKRFVCFSSSPLISFLEAQQHASTTVDVREKQDLGGTSLSLRPRLPFRKTGVRCHVLCAVSSVVSDSAIPRTVAHQAPLALEFSRQEYWSGLPFPSPEQKAYTHKLIHKMTLKETFECSQVGAEDQQFRWNQKLNAVTSSV